MNNRPQSGGEQVRLLERGMPDEYIEQNDASRRRLAAVAGRLSDEQLATEMSDGWTVSASFAHLAFFDHRATVLLRRFEESGFYDSPLDLHVLNDALLPQQKLMPARIAVDDALAAAEESDRAVAGLPADLAAQILQASPRMLNRHVHRTVHLDEIETLFP